MPAPNRSALIGKLYKALKKHYKPFAPPERPLLEHLLFACLLENSPADVAEKSLADVRKSFHDLNEVRVSSVAELSEHMTGLHEPRTAAYNLRRVLHAVFESTYSFDLESLKKKTLGQAVKELEKLGCTPFVVSYAIQVALGGHAIPLDKGALDALAIVGLVTSKEAAAGEVPGLERAIPKNRGIEFGSLLHQLGVDLLNRPFAPEVRELFLSISPDCKDRLPKRAPKKEEPHTPAVPPPEPPAKLDKSTAAKSIPGKPTPVVKSADSTPVGKSSAKPSETPHTSKKVDLPKDRAAEPAKPAVKKDPHKPAPSSTKPQRPAKPATKPSDSRAAAKGLSKTKPR